MSLADLDLNRLTIPYLKAELRAQRLPVSGNKADLIARLQSSGRVPITDQARALISAPSLPPRATISIGPIISPVGPVIPFTPTLPPSAPSISFGRTYGFGEFPGPSTPFTFPTPSAPSAPSINFGRTYGFGEFPGPSTPFTFPTPSAPSTPFTFPTPSAPSAPVASPETGPNPLVLLPTGPPAPVTPPRVQRPLVAPSAPARPPAISVGIPPAPAPAPPPTLPIGSPPLRREPVAIPYSELNWNRLTVPQLRAELRAQGLATRDNKPELIPRLVFFFTHSPSAQPLTEPVQQLVDNYRQQRELDERIAVAIAGAFGTTGPARPGARAYSGPSFVPAPRQVTRIITGDYYMTLSPEEKKSLPLADIRASIDFVSSGGKWTRTHSPTETRSIL